jgi:hypothetical protein
MARQNGASHTRSPKATGRPNPTPSAPGRVTIKQQRAARTAQKLAKFKRQQAQAKHRRLLVIVGSSVVAVAVMALLVVVVVTSGTPKTAPATVPGVQTFRGLTADHVSGPVNYPQTPPVGGPHAPIWLNCAAYSKPVPNENAVHSLEHGSVWVTYDPAVITGNQLAVLRKDIPTTYAILSPYKGLPSPIVASAWGVQLQVNRADDPLIAAFITKYRQAKSAPEPGAPCTGGIDGPGKIP